MLRIYNDERFSFRFIMPQKQLRNFISEIFTGLPIGTAVCAAMVLLALTFVPVSTPSSDKEKSSPLPSNNGGLEQRIAVRLGRGESLQGLLHRFDLRPGSAQK